MKDDVRYGSLSGGDGRRKVLIVRTVSKRATKLKQPNRIKLKTKPNALDAAKACRAAGRPDHFKPFKVIVPQVRYLP